MSKTVVHEIDPAQTHGFESITGDRPYTSELFTKLHNALSLGGYASNDAGHLDVFATGTDKIVTVQTGTAFVAGHFLELKNTHDISLEAAPAGQIRWDLIAIRIDRASAERKISIIKVEGNATATDDNSSIPWDQLQTDELLLGSGIFEFPIAAVKTSGEAHITQDRILKTLPSVNPLEPMYVFLDDTLGSSAQIGGRILIPNEPPANTPHEITIRVRIPETTSTKELALVINDFLSADTIIPVKDQAGTNIEAKELSGQSIFITIDPEKTKATTQKPIETYNITPLNVQQQMRTESVGSLYDYNKMTFFEDKILSGDEYLDVGDLENDGNIINERNIKVTDLPITANITSFKIFNNYAYWLNDSPDKVVVANIDSDLNFTNFRTLNLSGNLSPQSAWIDFEFYYDTTTQKNMVFFLNKSISNGAFTAEISADGTFSNFRRITNLMNAPDQIYSSISIINGKFYIHSEDGLKSLRADNDGFLNIQFVSYDSSNIFGNLGSSLNISMGIYKNSIVYFSNKGGLYKANFIKPIFAEQFDTIQRTNGTFVPKGDNS